MSNKLYPQDSAVRPVVPNRLTKAAPVIAPQPRDRILGRVFAAGSKLKAAILGWLIRHSIAVLRTSLGAVLLGFGALKYFPGMSPAQSLVLATMHLLTLRLVPAVVPGYAAMIFVATLECTIGLLLILGRWLRVTVGLMAVHLTGILSPVVLLPGRMFAGPHHMPTLEGQYVLKDVVLLGAGMVVAATAGGAALAKTDQEIESGISE
ncbi:MAG: DoxX family protein [Jatrophihabitantaceae bacterium]